MLQRGDLDALDAIIEEIARLAAQRSSPVGRWHEHRLRTLRAAVRGAFDEARVEAEAGLRIAERSGDASMVGMYYAFRFALAHLRGDPGEVPEVALPMLENPPPVPVMRAFSAHVLALRGDQARAVALLEEVRHLPDRMPFGPRWMGTVGSIGLAAAAVGDADLAGRCYRLLAPTAHWYAADGGGGPIYNGSNEYSVGTLALAAGSVEAAKAHFERAVPADLRIGARPYVALARLGLAQCLAAERQQTPAAGRSTAVPVQELASEAAAEFLRLDMPGPLGRAQRLLAQVAPLRDPARVLSPRELEVARMIGEAQTNQQIADRLFLSVRTVESHVRSALAKLQFNTRTELALWVRSQAGE